MNKAWYIFFLLLVIIGVIFISFKINSEKISAKINGVSFVAPHKQIVKENMTEISHVNANWIAIIPYAFSKAGEPLVSFDHSRQWWGERTVGVIATIKMAQDNGHKVMLKPHVWVRGQGWAGDFDLKTETEWNEWEKSYRNYIMTYAHIADSMNVPLLCIGTEFRKPAVERKAYWEDLILDIRKIYSGKLTYAANWDNYDKVTFWPSLDFIGIDAYFPLSKERTPKIEELNSSWSKIRPKLELFSKKYNRQILFTEFGYQSIDYTSGGHWNYDTDTLQVNLEGQANAYEATYESLWHLDWFAGGFLWKWHAWHSEYGGDQCKRYTPQNKPAQEVIAKWYKP